MINVVKLLDSQLAILLEEMNNNTNIPKLKQHILKGAAGSVYHLSVPLSDHTDTF